MFNIEFLQNDGTKRYSIVSSIIDAIATKLDTDVCLIVFNKKGYIVGYY